MVHRADGVGGGVDGHLDRILEVVPDEVTDVAVERRREQHRLGPGGAVPEDPLDLRREAVVGHPVGLVEHDHVDVGEGDLVGLQQVDEPQRCRDDDLHALAERVDLVVAAGSAVDGEDALAGEGWRPARGPRRPARPARAWARAPARAAASVRRWSMIRASIGTPNASVLPEPVRARPHTSRPSMATGIASVWILNGWANPAAARPSSMRAGTPSSANPVGGSTAGRTAIVVSAEVLEWWTDRSEEAGRRARRRRRGAPRRGVASVMVAARVAGQPPDRAESTGASVTRLNGGPAGYGRRMADLRRDAAMTFALDAPEPSDGEVLRRVRAGETAAYGQLYERHVAAARRLARTLVGAPADADDIVAEVFAATFAAIRRGQRTARGLPAVRAALGAPRVPAVVASRSAVSVARAPTSPSAPRTRATTSPAATSASCCGEAFVTLPARMQSVLWSVEVDGPVARRDRPPHAVDGTGHRPVGRARPARRSACGTSRRTWRARPTADLPVACATARASLAELVRGTATLAGDGRSTEHLAVCPACAAAHDDLCVVNERLRGLTLLAVATTVAVPKRWVGERGDARPAGGCSARRHR